MRYHFTPAGIANIKTVTSVGEDVERLQPAYIAFGDEEQNGAATLAGPQKQ